MDTSVDNRHLKEVLAQFENLRLSTPVRKNDDNTDDNKENILAGQDISKTKSEEKGTETVSTPVFNSRDSNQSFHSTDKFNDISNLEEESKYFPPPHPATESKSSVWSNVDLSEVSPETSDPFVYHCVNLQQTVEKNHNNHVIQEQSSASPLNSVNKFVDESEKPGDFIEIPVSEGNLNQSFIESDNNYPKRDPIDLNDNPKIVLFTPREPSCVSNENLLDSDNCRKQENCPVNKTNGEICGESPCSDEILEDQGYDPVAVTSGDILLDNCEVDEDPEKVVTSEGNLNSTLTIVPIPEDPVSVSSQSLAVTANDILESSSNIVCTDNQIIKNNCEVDENPERVVTSEHYLNSTLTIVPRSEDPVSVSSQSFAVTADDITEESSINIVCTDNQIIKNNCEVDEDPERVVEHDLNSTLTILPRPENPVSVSSQSAVTSNDIPEDNSLNIVCTDNQNAVSFSSNDNELGDFEDNKKSEDSSELELVNGQISEPDVSEPYHSEIKLEASTGDKHAQEAEKDGISTLSNFENTAHISNTSITAECAPCDKEATFELSNSVAEDSVYEDCSEIDENSIASIPVNVTDCTDEEKLNSSSTYESVNTTLTGSVIREAVADSELDSFNNKTINSQETSIDKSTVDLVCDSSENSPSDSFENTEQGAPKPCSDIKTSSASADKTTEKSFKSIQEELNRDVENVCQEVAVNKSSSAFIVLSPPKPDKKHSGNSNFVTQDSLTDQEKYPSEQKKEEVEAEIPRKLDISVQANNSHLQNTTVDGIEDSKIEENLQVNQTNEELIVPETNIPEEYRINFKEMADVNEKLQQENSDLKLELNALKQAKASLELEMGKKDEIILKTQAEALKKEQQSYQDIKTLKEQLKEKSIMNEENNVKELEEALKEAKAKESHALGELNARINDELNYRKIMEEYEKTIAARIADSQKLKEENETVTRHLRNLELSFSDLHQKYERTKNIIDGFKTNEERLREKFVIFEDTIRKQEEKYESLKAHARAQIEKSNKEIIQHREKYDSEVNKLNAIIKRLEIKSAALETSLEQKTKECIALAALCDEVTGKKV